MTNMKIRDIKIYPLNIKAEHDLKIATMTLSGPKNVLVHIITNTEIDGWGEASPFRAIVGETQSINFSAGKELREIFIGKNPLEYADLIRKMNAWLPNNSTIRSAFDMALYDIASKSAGLPLYKFLGGKKRPMETDNTMGIGDIDKAGDEALKIVEQGFRIIKTKVGINEEEDIQRIKNIRKAVGNDIKIRIDANQGWDRVTAVKSLQKLEELDIEICEQPLKARDLDGMRYINQHSSIPIMADESVFTPTDALEIIKTQSAPYINIKLSKSGGIYNGTAIANICEAGHITCMVGCMSESGLANTAFSHFAMANPVVKFFDLDANIGHIDEPIIGGATIKNGMVEIPEDVIGIGAYPDPDYIKKIRSL
ncbi:MAG: dipeptide epimerase [Candidatus Marinimicrobia bacterium]|nr:dipeptide epimerase [Candidatus Neomarinimicrobiota bacterium]